MKYIYFVIVVLGLMLFCASCEKAREDVYSILPDINIKSIHSGEELPIYFYQGDTLRLAPIVTYGEQGNEVFDFHWYRQFTDSLSLISEEPTLEYELDELGSVGFRLEVVHKETGTFSGLSFSISVTGHSELGWYVLKENSLGNTDLDLFRITKEGEPGSQSEDLLKQRDCILEGTPQNLLYTYNYSWMAPGASYLTTGISTLIPLSEKGMAAFRLNDSKVLESGEDLFYDNMDHIYKLQGGAYDAMQVVLLNQGKVHLMTHGMSGFLSEMPGNYSLSPWMTASEANGARLLGFDEVSRSFIHISTQASSLSFFPDEYLDDKIRISPNGMNGRISFLENTTGTLNPDTIYPQKAYALFHEDARDDRFILLGLDLAQIDPSQNDYGAWRFSPIMWSDTISYQTLPNLRNSQVLTMNKDFSILYYAHTNKISSYDIETRVSKENILSYSGNEEITYMHYLICDYATAVSFRNFIVATYNASSDTYKIYRYSIAGDDIRQEGEVLSGKGKVKTVVFASPEASVWQSKSYCYF